MFFVRLLTIVSALALLASCSSAPRAEPARRRAILVSFDAFNVLRFRQSLDSSAIPAFTRLVREGACAPYALTQWATQTPIAHAALWTGVYAHGNGVGRHEAALPESQWTWLEPRSDQNLYQVNHLAAEPLWITAARKGLSVFAHHPTHAPGAPAYRRLDDATPEATLESLRNEAREALTRPGIYVMNGYNERYPPRVIRPETHPPNPANGWKGISSARPGALPPLEVSWDAGLDSLHALIRGDSAYREIVISPTRDVGAGVIVRPFPADTAAPPGDTTARQFSPPLELWRGEMPVLASFRLFDLSPDARQFVLYQVGLDVVQGNRPGLVDDYLRAGGGWIGNAFGTGLGDWLGRGGDGTAEDRQLDIHAFLVRQWTRGTRWAWEHDPDLLIDYNPSADHFDHDWLGLLAADAPGYDPAVADRVRRVRRRGYALLDRHLQMLIEFALADSATILFVTSDHGMRPVWQAAYPNALLARAGLLATDSTGAIDLSRTRALSPDGYGIVVNRVTRKGGIVDAADEAEVVNAARRVMESAHGPDGSPLTARIYTMLELDSLFGSGPGANELYLSWSPGIRGDAGVVFGPGREPLTLQALPAPRGDHGATLPYLEAQAAFCAFGHPVRGGELPVLRQIDVAPTVAEWLRIEPPRHAAGRSVLDSLLRRR